MGIESVVAKSFDGWDEHSFLAFEIYNVVLKKPYALLCGRDKVDYVLFDLDKMIVEFGWNPDEEGQYDTLVKPLQINVEF